MPARLAPDTVLCTGLDLEYNPLLFSFVIEDLYQTQRLELRFEVVSWDCNFLGQALASLLNDLTEFLFLFLF